MSWNQNELTETDDLQIINHILNGEVNQYEILVNRYKDYVMKIVSSHVHYDQAAETCHDVFVRAYQSLPQFKHKGSFKSWISRIAIRTCHDYWRIRYRSRELSMTTLGTSHTDWIDQVVTDQSKEQYERFSRQKEARDVIEWALSHLSAQERMVLELVSLKGYSVKEAARLLGWSSINVKVRAFRARGKLKKLLEDPGKDI